MTYSVGSNPTSGTMDDLTRKTLDGLLEKADKLERLYHLARRYNHPFVGQGAERYPMFCVACNQRERAIQHYPTTWLPMDARE